MTQLIVQKWEESEAGWGVRPDGYSLHLADDDLQAYVDAHWAALRAEHGENTPHEYDRPVGTPYVWFDPDKETYSLVVAAAKDTPRRYGIRMFDTNYPGSGGTDGWVKR